MEQVDARTGNDVVGLRRAISIDYRDAGVPRIRIWSRRERRRHPGRERRHRWRPVRGGRRRIDSSPASDRTASTAGTGADRADAWAAAGQADRLESVRIQGGAHKDQPQDDDFGEC